MPSKVFGPTDSVADTLTQVGSTYQMPPGDWLIHTITVSKGNVVNAKSNSGHIHIETVERSYDFAYGGGIGGATNSHTGPAEKIAAAIHAKGNTNVSVYVLDADAAKDVTVALQFRSGGGNNFRTMAAGGVSGSGDTAADTEESMTVSSKLTRASLQPAVSGRIYQIRFAGTGVVDAKANAAKLDILIPDDKGPYEYTVGNGAGGATLGGVAHADVIDIPDGIPVKENSTIDIKITSAEIIKSPVISLSYW